jgi:hypothetical protein
MTPWLGSSGSRCVRAHRARRPAFPHRADGGESARIVERVAVDGDQVGLITGGEPPGAVT